MYKYRLHAISCQWQTAFLHRIFQVFSHYVIRGYGDWQNRLLAITAGRGYDARMKRKPVKRDVVPGFAGALRRLRGQRGWTLRALADRAGVTIDTVIRLERGNRSVSFRLAIALADALGVKVDALRGTADDKPRPTYAGPGKPADATRQ